MGARFAWWQTGSASVGLTLAAAPGLVVAVVPTAGAPRVAPDPARGLVPVATRDVASPAPGLEGSLAPSREKANPDLATAGPVLANPNHVLTPANPGPVLLSENPNLAQRVVQR